MHRNSSGVDLLEDVRGTRDESRVLETGALAKPPGKYRLSAPELPDEGYHLPAPEKPSEGSSEAQCVRGRIRDEGPASLPASLSGCAAQFPPTVLRRDGARGPPPDFTVQSSRGQSPQSSSRE